MSKTAYDIESELKGSAVVRTGFGGRPELINFFIDGSGDSVDASMMPKFDALDLYALRYGKMVPVVTKLLADGESESCVCAVKVTMADDVPETVVFTTPAGDTLTFTVADGTWAFAAAK